MPLLEEAKGIGTVVHKTDGSLVAQLAEYRVEFWQGTGRTIVPKNSPAQSLPGQLKATGEISGFDCWKFADKQLVLHMKDGRRLQFLVHPDGILEGWLI